MLQATAKLEELDHARKGKARFPMLSNKRVLAFALDVLPLHLDDEKDFRAAVMGLVQVHLPPQALSLVGENCSQWQGPIPDTPHQIG